MGYADLDPSPGSARAASRDAIAWSEGVIGLVVRLAGLALLVLGAALALKVVVEAVGLYQQPTRIERFARAVEQGSQIDRVLSPETDRRAAGQSAAPGPTQDTGAVLRLSYFAAWFIILMLLLVVSGIAVSLVSAGGRLALGAGRPRST